jgi:hypothetical protein
MANESEPGVAAEDIPVAERITYGTDAHADDPDEDPEEHIGPVIADPWDDPEQRDWATETLALDEVSG